MKNCKGRWGATKLRRRTVTSPTWRSSRKWAQERKWPHWNFLPTTDVSRDALLLSWAWRKMVWTACTCACMHTHILTLSFLNVLQSYPQSLCKAAFIACRTLQCCWQTCWPLWAFSDSQEGSYRSCFCHLCSTCTPCCRAGKGEVTKCTNQTTAKRENLWCGQGF